MLGSHYGDDHDYAGSRIIGTVVKLQGLPVQVENVLRHEETGKATAVIRSMSTGESVAVDLSALDLEPFKLGFVNYHVSASYICRMPMRRDYKQGMRHQNLYSHYGYAARDIPLTEYYNTLINSFPSFSHCLKVLQEAECESMAWHLNWAIDNEDNLLYKFGRVVGKVEDNRPVLSDKFMHLREQLEESIV